MTTSFRATFDGKVLKPDEPLELAPNTRVQVTIEIAEPVKNSRRSFLQTARSLQLKGPPDWSARLEEYLYGEKPDPDA